MGVMLPSDFVKGDVHQEPKRHQDDVLVRAFEKSADLGEDIRFNYLILIIRVDAQLLQEDQGNHKQMGVVALEHPDEELRDLPLLHLPLDLVVLREVE